MIYDFIAVYAEINGCNTIDFQLGPTGIGTTIPTRQWNIRVSIATNAKNSTLNLSEVANRKLGENIICCGSQPIMNDTKTNKDFKHFRSLKFRVLMWTSPQQDALNVSMAALVDTSTHTTMLLQLLFSWLTKISEFALGKMFQKVASNLMQAISIKIVVIFSLFSDENAAIASESSSKRFFLCLTSSLLSYAWRLFLQNLFHNNNNYRLPSIK